MSVKKGISCSDLVVLMMNYFQKKIKVNDI